MSFFGSTDALRSARSEHLTLVVGGRGASIVRTSRVRGRIVAETLATVAIAAGANAAAESAAAAVETAGVSGKSASLLLCEVVTRSLLVPAPKAAAGTLRKLLQAQLGSDESFVFAPVGEHREGKTVLTAHFVTAASCPETNRIVAGVEGRGLRIDGVFAYDAVLRSFARPVAGDTTGVMKIVVGVEPQCLDFSCVADGRTIFVRRVEIQAEATISERLNSLLGEAQKTALVVRGRLRPPPLSKLVLSDPLGLLPEGETAEAAEAAGLPLERAAFEVDVAGAADPADRGAAIRAAIVFAAGRPDAARLPCKTSATRSVVRDRTSAALIVAAACLATAGVVRTRFAQESERLTSSQTASDWNDDHPEIAAKERVLHLKSAFASFRLEHGSLLRFAAATGPKAGLLREIANATPAGVAFTGLSVVPSEAASGRRDVRIDGFVPGGLAEARNATADFAASLAKIPGVVAVREPRVEFDPFAKPAVAADRRITPFAFVLSTETPP